MNFKHNLKIMLQLKKDQDDQKLYLKQELDSFKNLHKAIKKKTIFTGESADSILNKVGAPALKDEEQAVTKWVYLDPAKSSWFSGRKIRLYFDAQKNLVPLLKIGRVLGLLESYFILVLDA